MQLVEARIFEEYPCSPPDLVGLSPGIVAEYGRFSSRWSEESEEESDRSSFPGSIWAQKPKGRPGWYLEREVIEGTSSTEVAGEALYLYRYSTHGGDRVPQRVVGDPFRTDLAPSHGSMRVADSTLLVSDFSLTGDLWRFKEVGEMQMGDTKIEVLRGDITEQEVDAIVNAANSSLLGGGGVDGAIHARGGPTILEECRELRRTELPDGLPTGEAVITGAGDLPARHVIHTVGPIWHGGDAGEDDHLASAYRSSLERAREAGLRSIAFPAISTGAYGFPLERAADLALRTVRDYLEAYPDAFDLVRFVLFAADDLEVYQAMLDQI